MSEITREALEGMGFIERGQEDNDPYFTFRYNSHEVFVSLEAELWVSANSLHCPHIRTLPQLRRLIRSLFGDDALPRRELSTITDEECRHIVTALYDCDIVHMNVIRSGDAVHLSFRLSDGLIEWHDHIKIFFTGNARREVGGGENLGSGVLSALFSYLIKELDMYLPAFMETQNQTPLHNPYRGASGGAMRDSGSSL